MKAITRLFACGLFFGLSFGAAHRLTAASSSSPRVMNEIGHANSHNVRNHNKHEDGLSLTNAVTVDSGGATNLVQWHCKKPFSIVLPASNLSWSTLHGTTNTDNQLFDPKYTVVIDSANDVILLSITNLVTNTTSTYYHIAVRRDKNKAQEKTAAAPIYNYDMIEATLSWDDISGGKNPK
jgi:hypothetical protein